MSKGTYKERYGLPGETVKLLRDRWTKKSLSGQGWATFDEFLKWSSESGYELGAHLRKYDDNEPHGPDNSVWFTKKSNEEESVEEKTPEVPTKHPCLECARNKTCGTPCLVRQMWWDIQMAKIRKALKNET